MTPRPIIGLAGLIGAGKTTAAMHLVEHYNFRRIRFAGPLKDMMRALGLNEREIEGDLKERPCVLLGGKTPRWGMQTLGTDWARALIDPDLWVRAWAHAVDHVPDGVGIVADDCRFPNEAAAICGASPFSMIVRVTRPSFAAEQSHVSEFQAFKAHAEIVNDGTVDQLFAKIDDLIIPKIRKFS